MLVMMVVVMMMMMMMLMMMMIVMMNEYFHGASSSCNAVESSKSCSQHSRPRPDTRQVANFPSVCIAHELTIKQNWGFSQRGLHIHT